MIDIVIVDDDKSAIKSMRKKLNNVMNLLIYRLILMNMMIQFCLLKKK